jgi:hypothetical protein
MSFIKLDRARNRDLSLFVPIMKLCIGLLLENPMGSCQKWLIVYMLS